MTGLAVSNIAWPVNQDDVVARMLVANGVHGIEIAPTKVFGDPAAATDEQIDTCRNVWADRGLKIVAAQALLFGRGDLTLFADRATRERTTEHMRKVIHTCARAGAEALVFGSPKNRWVGDRNRQEVAAEAIEFFRVLGTCAANEGTHIVMEAIPPQNGADYILNAAEAIELVQAVDSPGFRLHFDTACMTLARDALAESFDAGFAYLRHFHISEPGLAPVGTGGVDHAAFARELRTRNYDHWISIEMRESDPFDLQLLAAAVELAQRVYMQK